MMVDHNKTIEDISMCMMDRNTAKLRTFGRKLKKTNREKESILMSMCKYGDVKGLRLIKSLMDEQLFINHICSLKYVKNTSNTPIQEAIRYNRTLTVKYIFSDEKFLNNFDEENVYKAIYTAFTNKWASIKTINVLVDLLKLTQEKVKEVFNYHHGDEGSIDIVTISPSCGNVEVLQRIHDILGKDEFCKRILRKQNNRFYRVNAVECAVDQNETEVLKYFMSFEVIKHEYINNKDMTWRLVYKMSDKEVRENTIKCVVNELNLLPFC